MQSVALFLFLLIFMGLFGLTEKDDQPQQMEIRHTADRVDADVVNVNVDGVTDTMEDQASADTDAKISDQLKTTGVDEDVINLVEDVADAVENKANADRDVTSLDRLKMAEGLPDNPEYDNHAATPQCGNMVFQEFLDGLLTLGTCPVNGKQLD